MPCYVLVVYVAKVTVRKTIFEVICTTKAAESVQRGECEIFIMLAVCGVVGKRETTQQRYRGLI